MQDVPGYDLKSFAGAGAMGQVWSAVHKASGVPVAIKFLPSPSDPRMNALQLREIRATATLDHPNIVRVVDTGQLDSHDRWLALEWCGGGTLEGVQDWSTLEIAIKHILKGLAHAHARRILHRDIKPGNILRNNAGIYKLADFGVARLGAEGARLLAGSPDYMAPEVFERRISEQGPWTDLYSLGCTVWTIATGSPPFPEESFEALSRSHIELFPPSFHPLFDVPSYLEDWLRLLLHKDPIGRPRSAEEALARFTEPEVPWTAPLPQSFPHPPQQGRDTRINSAGLGLFPFREPSFQGRLRIQETLWSRLRVVVQQGTPHVVVLWGKEGMGRTRIAVDFAQYMHQRGLAIWGQIPFAKAGLDALDRFFETTTTPTVIADWQEDMSAVLILDDVDDPITARALGELIADHSAPVLWIITAKEKPDNLLNQLPNEDTTLIDVAPLQVAAMHRVLKQALGLSETLRSQVVQTSQGNIGLAMETLQRWVLEGRLQSSKDGFVLAHPPPPPPLSTDLIRGFEVVAICGGHLDIDLWVRACEDAGYPLDWGAITAFTKTRRASFTGPSDKIDGFVLHPGHGWEDLAQTAIESGTAHQACETLLALLPDDDDRRGPLLLGVGRPTEGIDALLRSSVRAEQRGDPGKSIIRSRWALREAVLLNDTPRIWSSRIRLVFGLSRAWLFDETIALLESWSSDLSTANPSQRAQYWIRLALAHRFKGNIPFARQSIDRALAVIERGRLSNKEKTQNLQSCVDELVFFGDLEEAEVLIREALSVAESPLERSYALTTLGRVFSATDRADDALEAFQEAVEFASRGGSPIVQIASHCNIADIYGRVGDLRSAEEHLLLATALAAKVPNYHAVILQLNLAANQLRLGHYPQALKLAEQLVTHPRIRRMLLAKAASEQVAATAHAGMGHWAEFAEGTLRLLQIFTEVPDLFDPDFENIAHLAVELTRTAPASIRDLARELVEKTQKAP